LRYHHVEQSGEARRFSGEILCVGGGILDFLVELVECILVFQSNHKNGGFLDIIIIITSII
jgi:hypothetical protein